MAVPGHRSSKAATFLSKTDAKQPAGLPIALQAGGSLEALALAVKTASSLPFLPRSTNTWFRFAPPWIDTLEVERGAQMARDAALGAGYLQASESRPASSRTFVSASVHSGRTCLQVLLPHPSLPRLVQQVLRTGGSTLQRARF